MATSNEIIRVEHVCKTFDGGIKALDDCSLTIRQGEVVSIIGPSGSGKSTMLRCLNLLEVPTSGKVIVDGVDITADKVDQLLHTVIPNQYLNINSEAENDIGYVYSSKKSYVIKENNCFTTVAAWCTVLGYGTPSEIVSSSSSYTDYIAWKIYNQYGSSWTYVGDF